MQMSNLLNVRIIHPLLVLLTLFSRSGNNNQLALEYGRDSKVTQDKYDRNLKALREKASGNTCRLLNEYDVDVILGPCNSRPSPLLVEG